jgi:hypothetical protein
VVEANGTKQQGRHLIFQIRVIHTDLHFGLLHCFDHESVILRNEEAAPALARGCQLPERLVPADGEHVVRRIHPEQLSQVPAITQRVSNQAM